MFQPMNTQELEGWHEPSKDIIDDLEEAMRLGNQSADTTELYIKQRGPLIPYTKEETKAIMLADRFSHFPKDKHYFCRYCGEEIFPQKTGRSVYCSPDCATRYSLYRLEREEKRVKRMQNMTMQEWREEVREMLY